MVSYDFECPPESRWSHQTTCIKAMIGYLSHPDQQLITYYHRPRRKTVKKSIPGLLESRQLPRSLPHYSFHYYPEEDKLSVNVSVKPDINIHFIILSPQEGKEATLTDIRFRGEELEDGTAFISHFDTELNIISATFGNGKRLTNGRFDIHYTTQQQ